MAAGVFPGRKNMWPMLGMVAAGLFMGLATNFFASKPLPLFRPLAAAGSSASAVVFGEVDADFVQQFGSGPGTMLLDARGFAAYQLGHIPGAISLPLVGFAGSFPALELRLREARLLVVYCSGPTCNDSRDLARLLWENGLKSLLLYKGGMEDWSGRGSAIER
jgi:rhodanese-related sulfurtransferase